MTQPRAPIVGCGYVGIPLAHALRVHVDDLVSACIAVAKSVDARGFYNVTDGNNISSTEFMHRVASIANLPSAVEISLAQARPEFRAERLSFLNESRRVSNKRLLTELSFYLHYVDVGIGVSL